MNPRWMQIFALSLYLVLRTPASNRNNFKMPTANSRDALATAKMLHVAKRYSMSIQKNDDSEEMSAVNYVYSCGRIGES